MKRRNFITTIVSVLAVITISATCIASQDVISMPSATKQVTQVYTKVNALDLVANPQNYLNKYVTVNAKFDKFSTLGLDYAPAFRSSEDYISFLIQRSDVGNNNIPLSEMKIFLKRKVAEEHIDLNAGDEVEFSGKVFSTALGDVWMDANTFKVIKKSEAKK